MKPNLLRRIIETFSPQPSEPTIADYWDIVRQREGEVYGSCEVGALFEATQPIEAHYHTGGQNWMDTRNIAPGTRFLIEEEPTMHEFGGYHVIVLVDGTKALVDLSELHAKFTVIG